MNGRRDIFESFKIKLMCIRMCVCICQFKKKIVFWMNKVQSEGKSSLVSSTIYNSWSGVFISVRFINVTWGNKDARWISCEHEIPVSVAHRQIYITSKIYIYIYSCLLFFLHSSVYTWNLFWWFDVEHARSMNQSSCHFRTLFFCTHWRFYNFWKFRQF